MTSINSFSILPLLVSNPMLYFSIVLSILMSITLHELAHGWAAIRLGDDTPIHTGHMTFSPLVHMHPMSIVFTFVFGFAWGSMPIDPSRMRGKYADAWVSVAGPVMNLLIALVAMIAMIVFLKVQHFDDMSNTGHNVFTFLDILGCTNILLAIFNLIPVPPLDGSRILANLNPGYRNFVESTPAFSSFGFIMVFIVMSGLSPTPLGLGHISQTILHSCVRFFLNL